MQNKETKTKSKSKKRKAKSSIIFLGILLLVVILAAVLYFGGTQWWGLGGAQDYPRREYKAATSAGTITVDSRHGINIEPTDTQVTTDPEPLTQSHLEEVVIESDIEVDGSVAAQNDTALPVANTVSKETLLSLQQLSLAIDALPDVHHEPTGKNIVQSPVASNAGDLQSHNNPVDSFKSVVRVSKRKSSDKSKHLNGSLQLYKIQLKLLVNDMRWALISDDAAGFKQAKKNSVFILQRRFDLNDSQVEIVLDMFAALNTGNENIGEN